MKISQRRFNEKQLMTISVAAGSVFLVAIAALLFAGYGSLDAVKANNLVLRKDLKDLEWKREDIPVKEAALEKLEEDVQNNVTKLPSDKDVKVEEFIHFLADAAIGTRFDQFDEITLEKFEKITNDGRSRASRGRQRNEPEPKPTHFKKHAYNLHYRGTFYQFGRFINIIENDTRFMSIEAFKVVQPKSNLKDPVLDIYLKIVTYTYNEKTSDANRGATR